MKRTILVVTAMLFAGGAVAQDEPKIIKVDPKGGKVNVDVKELIKDPNQKEQPKAEVKKPKKSEAKVSAEAREVLDKVRDAYKNLKSLDATGTITADINVGGNRQTEKGIFTSSWSSPNKFRHEMAEDITVGSTGEKFYVHRPVKNDYKSVDAPKTRGGSETIPQPMRDVLTNQNISLMCALVDDAATFLVEGTLEVSKGPDVKLGEKPFVALEFKGERESYRVLLDPSTYLVRQVVVDMKKSIEASGAENVEKFTVTTDYVKTTVNPTIAEKAFAWAAPDGAREATAPAAEEGDAVALVGKDAPDFTLNGMDGKPVNLKDEKGAVIILDFWATWCGPCKVSLPGLNKLHKELSPKGLKTWAIDLEEDKAKIAPVAEKICPDIPVLLDEKSEVAKLYGVSGIPQTVVIGKDGKVKKVFVGAGNEAKIKAVVEAALGEK